MRRIASCFLAFVALAPSTARADDMKFDDVILVEGKGRDVSLLYVVLTEPKADLKKLRELVVKYAGTAVKEAAERKFKGATKPDEKPKYEGNVVFFVREGKRDRQGAYTGFSVGHLKRIAAKIDKEPIAAAWTFGELPRK